jgi:hypothetical protein
MDQGLAIVILVLLIAVPIGGFVLSIVALVRASKLKARVEQMIKSGKVQ